MIWASIPPSVSRSTSSSPWWRACSRCGRTESGAPRVAADDPLLPPAQLVELRDVNQITRAPRGELHRAEVGERADASPRVPPEVDEERVLLEPLVWGHGWHPVQDLDIAVARVELERDRSAHRRSGERAVDRMLSTEIVERLGEPLEVVCACLRDEVEVSGGAYDTVRGDGDPSDDHIGDLAGVEGGDDLFRRERRVCHRGRARRGRSAGRRG